MLAGTKFNQLDAVARCNAFALGRDVMSSHLLLSGHSVH